MICFFLFASFVDCVTTDDQCWAEINIQGMRLEGFVFTRTSASAPHICNVRCEQEIACQSYNYNRKEKICELNNRAKEARPEGLRSDPAWFYIQRLNGRGMLSIEREIFRGTIYHFIAHLGHISYKHPLRLLSKYILKKIQVFSVFMILLSSLDCTFSFATKLDRKFPSK